MTSQWHQLHVQIQTSSLKIQNFHCILVLWSHLSLSTFRITENRSRNQDRVTVVSSTVLKWPEAAGLFPSKCNWDVFYFLPVRGDWTLTALERLNWWGTQSFWSSFATVCPCVRHSDWRGQGPKGGREDHAAGCHGSVGRKWHSHTSPKHQGNRSPCCRRKRLHWSYEVSVRLHTHTLTHTFGQQQWQLVSVCLILVPH